MSAPTPYAVDRTGWPSGPWDGEPDRIEWRSDKGLPCLIVRSSMGVLCGYVGVPPGHPAHGWDLSEAEALDAHGGITYAAPCDEPICRVPAPGESDDVWWLGFDCAHADDAWPGLPPGLLALMGTYRPVAFVRAEVEGLAAQLAALAPEVAP